MPVMRDQRGVPGEGRRRLLVLLTAVAAGGVFAVRPILVLGVVLMADGVGHEEEVPIEGHQTTARRQGHEAEEHECADQRSSIRAALVETHNDMTALKLFFSELQ